MTLKSIVDELLKEKSRSLTWLSIEMEKTFDGLKLSLTKGSIKYNDIITMAKVLEVSPSTFFQTEATPYNNKASQSLVGDQKEEYSDLKNCKEMLATLKDQIKDKDKIISLLSKED